jgi:hypothetical protein
VNATTLSQVRTVKSETYELVLGGADEANAVNVEKREIDTPEVFQSTTPSSDNNKP